jgi:DNA-binding NtrC family response regulator
VRETGTTVLVVDDSDAIRLLCRVNLELEGHRVLESGTLSGARELLEAEAVDVVLLDISVGSDDGRSLLRELRRDRPDVGVAMITGSADASTLRTAGAHAVIVKPFELEDLKNTVARLSGRGAASL